MHLSNASPWSEEVVDHAWIQLLDVVGTERGHEVLFVQVRPAPAAHSAAAAAETG